MMKLFNVVFVLQVLVDLSFKDNVTLLIVFKALLVIQV